VKLVAGLLVIAAVATLGNSIWYAFGVRHTLTAALLHGAVLLSVVGAVLGGARGRALKGAPIGALAGIGGAASYWAIAAVGGQSAYGIAIPAAWVIMWFLLAALDGRWLRAPDRRGWAAIAVRGLAAAAFGGAAFFLVMGILWGPPPAAGRNYLVQFLAWAFAWAPGLFALTIADASITGALIAQRIGRGDPPGILDVRSAGEFAAGHVPGAVNIPFARLLAGRVDLPGRRGDELIVYCGHGPRAWIATTALRGRGRTRISCLRGHWAAWRKAGLPIER
jgi:rhodanese-related sulfurtransferase